MLGMARCGHFMTGKRPRQSEQPVKIVFVEALNANSLNMPQQSSVSTGLRLSFEEDPSSSSTTGGKFNNLAAEIQRQMDDMEQLMRLQEGRIRQRLIAKTEKHSKALLCAAAAAVSRKLHERDLQVFHTKQKNIELEEQITRLKVESRAWQNRVKWNEAVAASLKAQFEERNKEGSGDSEEEAVNASAKAMANISSSSCQIIHSTKSNNIINSIYMQNRELEKQRKCRVCRNEEACILVLPCRHLCVCESCDNNIDVCPLCSALKTATVQVCIT